MLVREIKYLLHQIHLRKTLPLQIHGKSTKHRKGRNLEDLWNSTTTGNSKYHFRRSRRSISNEIRRIYKFHNAWSLHSETIIISSPAGKRHIIAFLKNLIIHHFATISINHCIYGYNGMIYRSCRMETKCRDEQIVSSPAMFVYFIIL